MARLIRHEATGPVKIDPTTVPQGKMIFICACGLSRNLPYCDGSHKTLNEEPGTVCVYDAERRNVVERRVDSILPESST